MDITEKIEKEKRIRKEKRRINAIFKSLPDDLYKSNLPLIDRAAFLRVTLEDLEDDINENGTVEDFSQTAGISYERERIASRLHSNYVKNYMNIIKQLTALLPKMESEAADNALMDFIRNDPRRGGVK